MAAAIELRNDYAAEDLRLLAKASRDADQTRRLLSLAAIYDGGSRADAARIGGVGLQVVRDCVLRSNSSGRAGLIDRKAPGKAGLLTAEHRSALAQAVEDGPVPWRDGVVRWRLVDLAAWLRDEFGITASRQTLGRELRRMGYRSLSARPRAHGQNPEAMEAFRKASGRRRGDP
jgi:transposase